jgi:hypothetical protein
MAAALNTRGLLVFSQNGFEVSRRAEAPPASNILFPLLLCAYFLRREEAALRSAFLFIVVGRV